jgi:virulence-associated protein VapD
MVDVYMSMRDDIRYVVHMHRFLRQTLNVYLEDYNIRKF